MSRLLMQLMLCAALLAAPVARAQYGFVGDRGLDWASIGAPLSNMANIAVMNNITMINAASGPAGGAVKPTRMPRAQPAVQRNAQELAKVFPASSQAAMKQAFQQSMDIYQQVAAKMGWQSEDLDGAMAAYIVGNYMVFANREVRDEDFAAIADQLRRGGLTRQLAEQQSARAVRDLYEKSAMVGAFMALAYKSQQQRSQPEQVVANLRNSARENLRVALGTEPERLQIGERGVMLAK